jgi:hypothetical protein
MNKVFSYSFAINATIGLLSMVLLFHILNFVQVIPYGIVWAGKLNSVKEMMVFETISILINTFIILVLLLKANYIKNNIPKKIINGIIWAFVMVFIANTIGNLFAKTNFELYVFTPMTFILSLLCLRIVLEKSQPREQV